MNHQIFKHRIINLSIFCLMVLMLASCSSDKTKSSALTKKVEKYKKVTIEDQTAKLAKKLKIKTQKTITHFYTKYGKVSEKGYLVEEKNFDEDGNLISDFFFTSRGTYDMKFFYAYDDEGNKTNMESYNSSDRLKAKKEFSYDEYGNLTNERNWNFKSNGFDSYDYFYDTKGNLTSVKKYLPNGNLFEQTVNDYDENGNMIKSLRTNYSGQLLSDKQFSYDSLGRPSGTITRSPGAKDITYLYKYDSNDNLVGVNKGYVIEKYTFNENNLLETEALYDKDNYLQSAFKNFYNDSGLLFERIRYDGVMKPAVYIQFEYDYFNK